MILCINCNKETSNKKFCSSSCSASYNNRRRERKITKKCAYCNSILTRSDNTYCNTQCFQKAQNQERINNFLAGKYIGKELGTQQGRWLRNYLIEVLDEKCSECGIGPEYNNKALTLEVDHIDGKAYNNILENLRFLCPNCHSQTEFYRAKNKNSDRKNRYK